MRVADWLAENSRELVRLSDAVWRLAETALEERESAGLLAGKLGAAGFKVESGLSGMPTAFRAVWGEGEPRIAFLGEYDALSGLGQEAAAREAKVGGNGHGCGHNLLGVASMGAALALRYAMEDEGLGGTVAFFGCPAEETMTGKIRMAADGLFDGLDAALCWHPADKNGVIEESFLAMRTRRYAFSGTSSHAAAAPEAGRSALDAVELMNVGVNYLREHVPGDVRIHYSITDGGGEPNIVPSHAQSLYYVRAARSDTVEDAVARIDAIARGAALMTGTECRVEPVSGCEHLLHNSALEELLHDCLRGVPAQAWSEEDEAFAAELLASSGGAAGPRGDRAEPSGRREALRRGVEPLAGSHPVFFASSDVANVSWSAPTAQIWACCVPAGVIQHTWRFTASAGAGIGHRGMLYAARVLAEAGLRLASDPGLVARVREDFAAAKRNRA